MKTLLMLTTCGVLAYVYARWDGKAQWSFRVVHRLLRCFPSPKVDARTPAYPNATTRWWFKPLHTFVIYAVLWPGLGLICLLFQSGWAVWLMQGALLLTVTATFTLIAYLTRSEI